jgi:hypothetical protein
MCLTRSLVRSGRIASVLNVGELLCGCQHPGVSADYDYRNEADQGLRDVGDATNQVQVISTH